MIDIALATDRAYVPHAAALLRSVTDSNEPRAVTAHLMHPPELPVEDRHKLEAMVKDAGAQLRLHEIAPSAVRDLPSMGRISQVMWYRMLLPELLPDTSRVLYLDCDTLVIGDLAPLWEIDLAEHDIAAVTNVFPQDLLDRPERLGLQRNAYFNSGVLLMNLDSWRTREIAERILAVVREQPERIVFPDQDALNLVLSDRRLPLHPRWNAQNSLFYFSWADDFFDPGEVDEARAAPSILHFEGPAQAKPWHAGSTHPHRQAYLDARAATPWPDDTRPLVSIIVPSYNMGRFLPATLDSILEQDYRPLEVVVVDGASSDETVAILERYAGAHAELRWVSEPDDGPEDAINKGLAMIQGELAGIQSADDVYYPRAIRTAVEAFAAHPEVGIVYGDAELIDGDGNRLSRTSYLPYTLARYLCTSTFIPQSSGFFRPELAREVGGIRRRYFVFDIDLWIRMLFRAPAHKVPGMQSGFRRHELQRDKEVQQIYSSWRAMLAESPEIRQASWRVRRAARAGGRIIIQFYNPSGSARYAAAQMWLAILTYPPVIRAISKPRKLIPPPPTLRGTIRRVRARLGRRTAEG